MSISDIHHEDIDIRDAKIEIKREARERSCNYYSARVKNTDEEQCYI